LTRLLVCDNVCPIQVTHQRRQLEFTIRTWGGRRKGAGRKPSPGRRSVPHRCRIAAASCTNRVAPLMSRSARVRSCLLSDADRSLRQFKRHWAPPVADDSASFTIVFNRIICTCWWKQTRRRPSSAVCAGLRYGSRNPSTARCDGKAASGRPGIMRAYFELRARYATRSCTCSTIGASTSRALRASIRARPHGGSMWAIPIQHPGMPAPVARAHTWLARVGWRNWGAITLEESPRAVRVALRVR